MLGKNKEGGRFIKDIQELLPANAAINPLPSWDNSTRHEEG